MLMQNWFTSLFLNPEQLKLIEPVTLRAAPGRTSMLPKLMFGTVIVQETAALTGSDRPQAMPRTNRMRAYLRHMSQPWMCFAQNMSISIPVLIQQEIRNVILASQC